MSQDVERPVQERALRLWYQVEKELGMRIAQGLGIDVSTPAGAGE